MLNRIITASVAKVILLVSVTLLTACGGGGNSSNTKPVPITPVPLEKACDDLNLTNEQECLTVDERSSIVYKPANQQSYNGIAIYLHGAPGTPSKVFDIFDGKSIADKYNLISIAPEGNGSDYQWDSNNTGNNGTNNDINFINALIDNVQASYEFSTQNVYILGYSAGGFMAYKLACEMPEKLTAIISLAGQYRGDTANCTTSTPLAIHHMHSSADLDVPFAGRQMGNIASVNDTIALWALKNGCSEESKLIEQAGVTNKSPITNTQQYLGCVKPVTLSTLLAVQHEDDYLSDKLLATFEYIFSQ
ncbi:alpha/beta hydrolase family esterase [Thalassotalea atypica]|uniref:alpha/beta hydrolase family esterase n=1 Tax=Thalassotalea atypica TaxID=2054316 RepID=UPI002572C46B|nr:prolyl oligopeptidase family serine peptidase [Thalassotalea atypica]